MFLGYAYKLKAQTLALENMFTIAKCGSNQQSKEHVAGPVVRSSCSWDAMRVYHLDILMHVVGRHIRRIT